MIAQDLEINIEELKSRIRAEVDRRPSLLSPRTPPGTGAEPRYSEVLQFHLAQRSQRRTMDKLAGILERARAKTEVNRLIPKFLRRLFRKQGGYNKLLLESVQALVKSLRELRNENAETRAYLEAQYYWLRDFTGHRQEDAKSLRRLKVALIRQREIAGLAQTQLDRHIESGQETKNLISFALGEIDNIHSQQSLLAKDAQGQKQNAAAFARMLAEAQANQGRLTSEIVAAQQELEKLTGHFNALDSTLQHAGAVTADLIEKVQTETETRTTITDEILGKLAQLIQGQTEALALAEKLRQVEEDQFSNFSYLKGELSSQQSASAGESEANLKKSSRKRGGGPVPRDGELNGRFDALYLAFENRFRGARSEIKSRLEFYLPYLAKLPGLRENIRALDIGCGRGEWLELLKEKGYFKGEGVDLNTAMGAACRGQKLKVAIEDGIDYLSRARKASFNVITAFHVIEHLPFDRLMDLLTEAHRVLKRGGLLIVETPNPDNLIVGAKNFYTDPTHRNPLPSVLTKFLVEQAGFGRVEVVNQHPFGADMLLSEDGPVAARLNNLFYSEQDYAVIATKP